MASTNTYRRRETGGWRMRVLVADDDIFFLKVVTEILTDAGIEVHTARGGEAALVQVEAVKPDVVILDVVMPDLYGTDVCKRLRQNKEHRTLPIMLVSTGVDEFHEDGGDPKRYRADDFLHKPFKPDVLVSRVQRLVRIGAARVTQHRRKTAVFESWTDRRQEPRVPIDAEATATTPEGVLHQPMVNISEGGVCIEPVRPLAVKSEIELRFGLPGDASGLVAARGSVIWCHEVDSGVRWNVGVAFDTIRIEDSDRIGDYTNAVLHVVQRETAPDEPAPG